MIRSILFSTLPVVLMAAKPIFAACEGGYTYGYCEDRIVHWYDPDTGEICDPLHCGGDRAGPLRDDVPGCDAYTGTEVYISTPSFMPCFEALHSPTAPAAVQTISSTNAVEHTTDTIEAEPAETEVTESSSAAAPSTKETSSAPLASSSSESANSHSAALSRTALTTPQATTPAPTLSTVTQSTSSAVSTPAGGNPDSGASGLQHSLLALAGVMVLAFAITN